MLSIDDGRIAKLTVAATFAKNICVNGGTPSTAEVDTKVPVESTSSCHVMFVVLVDMMWIQYEE